MLDPRSNLQPFFQRLKVDCKTLSRGLSRRRTSIWIGRRHANWFSYTGILKSLGNPSGARHQNSELKSVFVPCCPSSSFSSAPRSDVRSSAFREQSNYSSDSWDGLKIAFLTNEDGLSTLHLLDTATGKELTVPKLPVGLVSGLLWHKNNRDLAFGISSAISPGDCYSLDVTTGKLDRWTYSETAVKTDGFREPELMRWKSFDGKMISGFLYRPPAKFTGKRPVLIEIHGGPEGQSRPDFLGRANYFVNELGIAIIFPNVRGSTGYGKTFTMLDNGFLREDSYKDINALVDWIASRPDLDATRIAVTGGSYGGHMTLAVSTFYSDRIRCSIDVVGMSNLVTFLEHTEGYRRDLRRVEYGDERDPKMREFLERIAPMNNIEKIKKPMMVVAGKNDPRVPVSESDQIVSGLQKQGTPVWYVMAKDEGHGFQKKTNRDYEFYADVEFLQEFLLK